MKEIAAVTKIELYKILKRKDSWLMLILIAVPILYSVGLASGSSVITYSGAGNITALGFTSAMFQMAQSMFVFNVILASITGRSMAAEIENRSILLYLNRIGSRRILYRGKEFSLYIYSVLIDILLILSSVGFYYAVLSRKETIANGRFYDENMFAETVQIICICMFWFITIYFVLALSTKLKTLVCVGIYMIFYIAMNLISYVNGMKYISPLFYIAEFNGDNQMALRNVSLFAVYLICAGMISSYIGTRRLEKMDL